MKGGWVYITANRKRTIFYVGVTSVIVSRIWEHKNHIYEKSYTRRYHVTDLVYYSYFETIELAISKEKEIKGWRRERKLNLIRFMNPQMKELYTDEFVINNS